MSPLPRTGTVVTLAALLASCAGPKSLAPRERPPAAFQALRTIAVVEPDVQMTHLGVSASTVDEEWSAMARARVHAALDGALAERRVATVSLPLPWRTGPLAERALLLDAVIEGLASCGRPGDPACQESFDHGVGPLDDVLPPGADALLVVVGVNEVETEGRIATQVALIPLNVALWTLIVYAGGIPAGGMGPPVLLLPAPVTYAGAGLLGRDGEVLWWGGMMGYSCCDLRDQAGARQMVDLLLEHFPLPSSTTSAGR